MRTSSGGKPRPISAALISSMLPLRQTWCSPSSDELIATLYKEVSFISSQIYTCFCDITTGADLIIFLVRQHLTLSPAKIGNVPRVVDGSKLNLFFATAKLTGQHVSCRSATSNTGYHKSAEAVMVPFNVIPNSPTHHHPLQPSACCSATSPAYPQPILKSLTIALRRYPLQPSKFGEPHWEHRGSVLCVPAILIKAVAAPSREGLISPGGPHSSCHSLETFVAS